MTLKELHQHLKDKFGDAVGEWPEPEAGEAWIEVDADAWRDAAVHLRRDERMKFDYLRCISGVDYVEWMEVVYHLYSFDLDQDAIIKVKTSREDPKCPSVMDLWPAADWHEREAYDMTGIVFEGHENLRRILLPEDWEGFPLRKDYKQPDEYHGISNW